MQKIGDMGGAMIGAVFYAIESVTMCEKTGQSSTYIDDEYDLGNRTNNTALLFILSVRKEVAVTAALAAPGYGESHPTTSVLI